MKRQKVRKLLLLISFLLFPVTVYYLSPVLILSGAAEGVINGSFLVFVIMMIGSILFGRLFCGYLCPVGGLQECAFAVNDKAPKQGWRNSVKYIIWAVWTAAIVFFFVHNGKVTRVDFFYQTQNGISVIDLRSYIIYYIVILTMLLPSLIFGKRIACHYFCWMAPFMVIGTKIRNLLHLPGLHIAADPSKCVSCGQCNKNCPMSLDVVHMAQSGKCENPECILCGACVDSCSKKVLRYSCERNK